jgi:hypothetical protein
VRRLPEAQAAGVDVLGLVHEQSVGGTPIGPAQVVPGGDDQVIHPLHAD